MDRGRERVCREDGACEWQHWKVEGGRGGCAGKRREGEEDVQGRHGNIGRWREGEEGVQGRRGL